MQSINCGVILLTDFHGRIRESPVICGGNCRDGGKMMQLDNILHHTNEHKTQKKVLHLAGLEPPFWQQGDLQFAKPFFRCLS